MPKRSIFVVFTTVLLVIHGKVQAGDRPVEERLAAIESTYSVSIEYNEYGAQYLREQVTAIEYALMFTGPAFAQKVNNIKLPGGYNPRFYIRISDDITQLHPHAVGSYQVTAEKSTLHLYPSHKYIPSATDVLHELGHAAAYLSDGQVNVFVDFTLINGEYTGVFAHDYHVSPYAATNASEDFAETFCFMVKNGGDAPAVTGRDTVLFQKYEYMHGFLVAYLGVHSRATQRAADFLDAT